ncbi:MAG: RNA polymerase sigma factor [Burkholderiales bacterium]|nr:RNA polymerase sigma factor [Burkholderiales bacterium]
MATQEQLSAFLAEVERRAFRQAMYAVQNEDVALDLVQDAMLKLAESYGDRPSEELPLLFQRILQNAIRDYYRRSKVRATWTTLLSAFGGGDDEGEESDPLETLEIEPQSEAHLRPEQQLQRVQTLNLIDEALQQLPARQREAFLLRYMEEMDVAETAAAMGCSEGSVKTHCSRAVHALAAWLRDKGVSP